MRPNTRSVSAKCPNTGESIKNTRDPCQVTFKSKNENLPIWRFVLFERYCGQFKPQEISSTSKETNQNDVTELHISPELVASLPQELWHTFIQVFSRSVKLLTIHIYHATGKILVQGNVCRDWIDNEFERLKGVVGHLSQSSDASPVSTARDSLQRLLPLLPPPAVTDNNCMLSEVSITTSITTPNSAPEEGPPSPSVVNNNMPTVTPASTSLNTSDSVPEEGLPSPPVINNLPKETSAPASLTTPNSAPEEGLPSPPVINNLPKETSAPASLTTPDLMMEEDTPSPTAPSPSEADNNNVLTETSASPSLTHSDTTMEEGTPSSDLSGSSPTDDTPSPAKKEVIPSATPTTPTVLSIADQTVPSTSMSVRRRSNSLTIPLTKGDTVRLQEQLISATLTIALMQQEIQTLKDQLAQTTQQTQQNTQSTNDAEVRMKNTLKTITQDFSQQMQELRSEHTTLQCQVKDTNNKLQSLKDSQSNIKSEIKKQIQTLSATKHTRHTGNQTDNATMSVSVSNTEHETYAVKTSNKYAALSHSSTTSQEHTPDAATKARNKANIAQTTVSSKQTSTHTHTAQHSHNTLSVSESCSNNSGVNQMQSRPSPLSPLTILRQKQVPRNCDTLLLGDSVLQGLDERKMSAAGNNIHKISVPGLTVHHLCQWLTSCPASPHIRHVIFHVGFNSCEEGPVSTADWVKLIRTLKRVFPSAALKASSILPPLGRHPLMEPASQSTWNLRRSCLREGVIFVDNTPSFLAKSGAPRKVMYRDRIHPSAQGYKFLALNLRCPVNRQSSSPIHVLRPDMTSPQQQSQSTPAFNYERDFPGNSHRNPHSHDVYTVLGRHHPFPQQHATPPPPPPHSLLHQPLSQQSVLPHPPHRPTSLRPTHLEQPWSERNEFIPPVNRSTSPPPPPVFPPHLATTRPMNSPIHPFAVQMLNSLVAQFLHQQQTENCLL